MSMDVSVTVKDSFARLLPKSQTRSMVRIHRARPLRCGPAEVLPPCDAGVIGRVPMARDGFGWDGGNESPIPVGVFAPAPGPYAHSARADTRNAHFWLAIARLREAAVDLGAHDVAVGGGVVETTQQRARQQVTGVLELGDLLVEGGQPAAGDGLPFRRSAGVKDAVDVVEGETSILEHADEHQPS